MTRTLTREEFFRLATIPEEVVAFPELGGAVVRVRGMSVREKTEWERSFRTAKGTPLEDRQREVRERLLIACCRNEDGTPFFTEADIRDLATMRADVAERLVNVAQRLCGMADTDVETLAKNAAATTTGASHDV